MEMIERRATYEEGFLMYVRRLFSGITKPPANFWHTKEGVPFGEPEPQLYQETMEAAAQMWPRDIMEFLVQSGGWEKKRCLDGEEVDILRLWEVVEFDELCLDSKGALLAVLRQLYAWQIGFLYPREGNDAIGLLNETIRQGKFTDGERFALFRLGVLFANSSDGNYQRLVPRLANRSGLLQLALRHRDGETVTIRDAQILEDLQAWGWTFPWLGHKFGLRWRALEGVKLNSLNHYQNTLDHLTQVILMLLRIIRENQQPAWIIPILDFFNRAYPEGIEPEPIVEQLDEKLRKWLPRARISELQDEKDRWAELLKITQQVQGYYTEAHRKHPMMRDPHEELLVLLWTDYEFAKTCTRVDALRTQLEGVMG
jgi:hypothetical protein